ncbi:MAG: O-antigen ligase family protein [Sarcina sp.]
MDLIANTNKRNELLLYITIFSIFITDIKLYIPLFALNIIYVIYLMLKKEVYFKKNTWIKSLCLFIIWFLINNIISILFFKSKIEVQSSIKVLLNLTYLLSVYLLIVNKKIEIKKSNMIILLKVIILLNFIQIMYIYFDGGLFAEFISGNLTKSSDSAYIIGNFNNIIGGTNKNIWASKFVLIFIFYIYTTVDNAFYKSDKKYQKIFFITIGTITTLLLLSRTAQLALIIPLVFSVFYSIRNIDKKYKMIILILACIGVVLGGIVFFNKLFHIKMDMSDGGFTRLLIWLECFKDIFKENLFIGNGIGSSGYFIQATMGRLESNAHNIFITTLYEFGLIGLTIYCTFLITFIKKYIMKKDLIKYIFVLGIPILFIVNLQYLGYDNDLISIMILFMILFNIKKRDEIYV